MMVVCIVKWVSFCDCFAVSATEHAMFNLIIMDSLVLSSREMYYLILKMSTPEIFTLIW